MTPNSTSRIIFFFLSAFRNKRILIFIKITLKKIEIKRKEWKTKKKFNRQTSKEKNNEGKYKIWIFFFFVLISAVSFVLIRIIFFLLCIKYFFFFHFYSSFRVVLSFLFRNTCFYIFLFFLLSQSSRRFSCDTLLLQGTKSIYVSAWHVSKSTISFLEICRRKKIINKGCACVFVGFRQFDAWRRRNFAKGGASSTSKRGKKTIYTTNRWVCTRCVRCSVHRTITVRRFYTGTMPSCNPSNNRPQVTVILILFLIIFI